MHITYSCIFHAYDFSFHSYFQIDCAMAPKAHKSTPARNPLQGSGSSSSDLISPLNVWFRDEKAQKDLLENFQKCGIHLKYQVILLNSPCCHSDLGLGISSCVYTGFLLQYTQYWYLCTSVCYYILKYTYCSYLESDIWGTTRFKGSASWLPLLWASWDCVQRRGSLSLLWDSFHMGW